MYGEHRQQLYNRFDCPIYCLSTSIAVLASSKIITFVSFVHHCDDSCMFLEDTVTDQIDHQNIDTEKLLFKHDYSNNKFCFNIFCMNQ